MDKLARPAQDMIDNQMSDEQVRRLLERQGLTPAEIDRALQARESQRDSRETI